MSAPVGFGRLCRAELDPLLGTRSGRVLLAGTVLAGTALIALLVAAGNPDDLAFPLLIAAGLLPQQLLVPLLAILLVAGGWTRRTTLVTFVLEPRRLRVALADAVVVLAIAAASAVSIVLVALGGHLLAHLLRGTAWSVGIDLRQVAGTVAVHLIWLLSAFGWAVLVQQPLVALVCYVAVPLPGPAWVRSGRPWPGPRTG